MLFNSIDFAIFLPVVFLSYWIILSSGKIRAQNVLLLVASYIFYGWWDWRFLSLIVLSSIVDFSVGIALSRTESGKKRRGLLWISILTNLGLLGVFKYYNFFAENFTAAFTFFGSPLELRWLDILLPVGISFYTFQTLSYTIDVYRRQMEPTRDFVAFFAFVSFFPQLVAGPIERAKQLLPQFHKARHFDYGVATDGMRQILWGLMKKMVIADNCAPYVNTIFANPAEMSGSTLLLGAVLFAFQIYGDFSGYSDIAIGTARLFDFHLTRNFACPYFSRDMAEFWRRWHITLSTWFRDYVYIPLGGSRGAVWMQIRNIFVVFAVSGLWHGASWTFIAWGVLNALYFLPLMLSGKSKLHTGVVAEGRLLPTLGDALRMGVTFSLTLIAWILFRSDSLSDAVTYLHRMLSPSLFSIPDILPRQTLTFVILLAGVEWFQRDKQHALVFAGRWNVKPVRWSVYFLLAVAIVLFGGTQQEFIYFRF